MTDSDRWHATQKVIETTRTNINLAKFVGCGDEKETIGGEFFQNNLEILGEGLSEIPLNSVEDDQAQELSEIGASIQRELGEETCPIRPPSDENIAKESLPVVDSIIEETEEKLMFGGLEIETVQGLRDYRNEISCNSAVDDETSGQINEKIDLFVERLESNKGMYSGEEIVIDIFEEPTQCPINPVQELESSVPEELVSEFEGLYRDLTSTEIDTLYNELDELYSSGDLRTPENGYVVYVNKKSSAQWAALVYFEDSSERFYFVGADTVSTANSDKYSGADTPLGVHYINRIGDAGNWGPPYGVGGQEVYDISVGNGAAFHPTNEKELLGQPASHGCIRMTDELNEILDRHNILSVNHPVVVGEF